VGRVFGQDGGQEQRADPQQQQGGGQAPLAQHLLAQPKGTGQEGRAQKYIENRPARQIVPGNSIAAPVEHPQRGDRVAQERSPQVAVVDVGVEHRNLPHTPQEDVGLTQARHQQRHHHHDRRQHKSKQLAGSRKRLALGTIPENEKSEEGQGHKTGGQVGIESKAVQRAGQG
jgi:hypothetical protein